MKKGFSLSMIFSILVLVLFQKFFHAPKESSLLIALIFWTALSQGIIALASVADLCEATWILPAKRAIQGFYPFLAILPLIFVIFSWDLSLYPWFQNPGRWLNKPFFISRNIASLVLTFLSAHFYIRASIQNLTSKNSLAVIYLVCFVVNQSLIAFDWVMPIEYPWVSTLLGGYFFVESFYSGISLTAFFSAILVTKNTEFQKVMKDSATLMFGFSLFWAGLFFAQYLVIWYGNIPEEVHFFFERFQFQSLNALAVIVLATFFVVPFLTLIFEKTKKSPQVVMAISLMIVSALLLEKIYIFSTKAIISPLFLCLNLLFAGLLFLNIFKIQYVNMGSQPKSVRDN